MLNLPQKYLSLVNEILKQHCPTSTVWAYGSRVKGTAHEGSDLDIAIFNLNQNSNSAKKLSEIRDAFEESNLPFNVDVFDWNTIPEKFKPEIEKNHFVLQSSSNNL